MLIYLPLNYHKYTFFTKHTGHCSISCWRYWLLPLFCWIKPTLGGWSGRMETITNARVENRPLLITSAPRTYHVCTEAIRAIKRYPGVGASIHLLQRVLLRVLRLLEGIHLYTTSIRKRLPRGSGILSRRIQ